MHGSHDPFLVVLSIVLAVLASYTALDLAGSALHGDGGGAFVPAPGAVSFAAGDLLARSELAVGVVVGTLVILALARLAIVAYRDVRPIQVMTGTAVLAGQAPRLNCVYLTENGLKSTMREKD
jgi:NO-binding membrane sensor protein with MHYT domain